MNVQNGLQENVLASKLTPFIDLECWRPGDQGEITIVPKQELMVLEFLPSSVLVSSSGVQEVQVCFVYN